MLGHNWTQQELKFIRENRPKLSIYELSKCPELKRHTFKSIEDKCLQLGIRKIVLLKNKEVENMKENPLEDYFGKDKIKGRPIRLNYQELEARRTSDVGRYATIKFLGDIHYGSRECDIRKVQECLDYCLKERFYVFLMGDLLESALKSSVGSGMYLQEINPQQQLEDMVEMLRPLAEQKLIIGALMGNHEFRIEKDTGINVIKVLCQMLNLPYLGMACWNLFRVENQNYKIYTLHGSSSSRFLHTKLKSIIDISHIFNADLICQGHVHELDSGTQLVQYIDGRTVKEAKKHLLLTGHFLRYDKSYAQEKGYPIGKMGSPNVKLFADRFDIHISL